MIDRHDKSGRRLRTLSVQEEIHPSIPCQIAQANERTLKRGNIHLMPKPHVFSRDSITGIYTYQETKEQ
jgi:hypothetical protein